jgi:hypothetical protein
VPLKKAFIVTLAMCYLRKEADVLTNTFLYN